MGKFEFQIHGLALRREQSYMESVPGVVTTSTIYRILQWDQNEYAQAARKHKIHAISVLVTK